MTQPLSITQARTAAGLRLMTVPNVPTAWSEAAKGLLYVENLSWTPFLQHEDDEADVLLDWTGQTSKPVLAWNDEPPATGWAEILHLVERLAPHPQLIPTDPADRIAMYGIAHELCGEMGFGWCVRLTMFADAFSESPKNPLPRAVAQSLGPKYHYSDGMAKLARDRLVEILDMLDARLAARHDAGDRYLIGDQLSAVDVYWATFCALLEPLPEALCATVPVIRSSYRVHDQQVNAALSERLLQHRMFIYERHLELPVRW